MTTEPIPDQPPDDQQQPSGGTFHTLSTAAAAALILGGLAYLAVVVLTYRPSGYTITNYVIWFIVVIWLIWLSFTVAGHHEHVGQAVDTTDKALSTAQDAKMLAEDALALVNTLADHLAGAEPAPTGRHAAAAEVTR